MRILIIISAIFLSFNLFGQNKDICPLDISQLGIDEISIINTPCGVPDTLIGITGWKLPVWGAGDTCQTVNGSGSANIADMVTNMFLNPADSCLYVEGQNGAFMGKLDFRPYLCKDCGGSNPTLNLTLLDITSDVDTTGLKDLILSCVTQTVNWTCEALDSCNLKLFGDIDTSNFLNVVQNQIENTSIFKLDTSDLKDFILQCASAKKGNVISSSSTITADSSYFVGVSTWRGSSTSFTLLSGSTLCEIAWHGDIGTQFGTTGANYTEEINIPQDYASAGAGFNVPPIWYVEGQCSFLTGMRNSPNSTFIESVEINSPASEVGNRCDMRVVNGKMFLTAHTLLPEALNANVSYSFVFKYGCGQP